jgi:hypothetical protein
LRPPLRRFLPGRFASFHGAFVWAFDLTVLFAAIALVLRLMKLFFKDLISDPVLLAVAVTIVTILAISAAQIATS